jgi:hypothetical protein
LQHTPDARLIAHLPITTFAPLPLAPHPVDQELFFSAVPNTQRELKVVTDYHGFHQNTLILLKA